MVLTSFNTDGFTLVGTNIVGINMVTNYVAWQWKANGGTTSSNTDGTITSTVQAIKMQVLVLLLIQQQVQQQQLGHGLRCNT